MSTTPAFMISGGSMCSRPCDQMLRLWLIASYDTFLATSSRIMKVEMCLHFFGYSWMYFICVFWYPAGEIYLNALELFGAQYNQWIKNNFWLRDFSKVIRVVLFETADLLTCSRKCLCLLVFKCQPKTFFL